MHVKFSVKTNISYPPLPRPRYAHVRALFSWNTSFEILPSALLPTKWGKKIFFGNTEKFTLYIFFVAMLYFHQLYFFG